MNAVKIIGVGRMRLYWYPDIKPTYGRIAGAFFVGKLSIQRLSKVEFRARDEVV